MLQQATSEPGSETACQSLNSKPQCGQETHKRAPRDSLLRAVPFGQSRNVGSYGDKSYKLKTKCAWKTALPYKRGSYNHNSWGGWAGHHLGVGGQDITWGWVGRTSPGVGGSGSLSRVNQLQQEMVRS